jgi:hypothetical protein
MLNWPFPTHRLLVIVHFTRKRKVGDVEVDRKGARGVDKLGQSPS